MRVTIDIADTPTGSAPVEIRVPEEALASPTSPAGLARGTTPGGTQPYDGGPDMATPVLPEAMTETGTPAPSAPAPGPGAALDGGAAPSAAGASPDERLPAQIETPARLQGGSAPG